MLLYLFIAMALATPLPTDSGAETAADPDSVDSSSVEPASDTPKSSFFQVVVLSLDTISEEQKTSFLTHYAKRESYLLEASDYGSTLCLGYTEPPTKTHHIRAAKRAGVVIDDLVEAPHCDAPTKEAFRMPPPVATWRIIYGADLSLEALKRAARPLLHGEGTHVSQVRLPHELGSSFCVEFFEQPDIVVVTEALFESGIPFQDIDQTGCDVVDSESDESTGS